MICNVPGDSNIADPLTKQLARAKHEGHVMSFGLRIMSDWDQYQWEIVSVSPSPNLLYLDIYFIYEALFIIFCFCAHLIDECP